jgi:adenosylmethionine---8-amino-7-oxononanoate aminotransferase
MKKSPLQAMSLISRKIISGSSCHFCMLIDKLTHIRSIGGIIAADLVQNISVTRLGFALSQAAIQHGALLRPIGNTLYWLPPLNSNEYVLAALKEATQKGILACY